MAYQMASIIMAWSDPGGHFSCLKPLKPPTPREIYHVLATICLHVNGKHTWPVISTVTSKLRTSQGDRTCLPLLRHTGSDWHAYFQQFITPYRSTTYVDGVYCYRPSIAEWVAR